MVARSKYKAYIISTHPLGRKYRYYRHEQNLYNAIKQTGFSHIPIYWIGGDERRSKWLYVPACILLPEGKLFVDFTTKKGMMRPSMINRKEILDKKGETYIQINPDDSQQEMYLKIKMKLIEMKQGK